MPRATDFELSALTLDEILSADYVCVPDAVADHLADTRLNRWCAICADGDSNIFHKRLLRDGLSLADVRARFAGVDRRPGCVEPSWVAECRNVLDSLKRDSNHDVPGMADHAFGPLLAPVVATAIREVDERCEFGDEQQISAGARANIVSDLWRRVEQLCALPLYRQFLEWRGSATAPRFEDFIQFMRSQGFDALFATYPPLLRLLTLQRKQWIEAYAEFVARLRADRAALSALEPSITQTSVLTGVTCGLSDPHDGGRTVLIATFDHTARVVYKPKDLGADQVIEEFLERVRDRGFEVPLRIPRHLARAGYGWTACIENVACQTPAEVDEYFRRAGAWLGFLYLLCATDMHMENLIACRSDPVPVDFETLFQGVSRRPKSVGAAAEAAWLANASLERSVLAVGLLPVYTRLDDQTILSVGGLEPSTVVTNQIVWRDLNSMSMRPEKVQATSTTAANLPTFHGATVTIDGHRGSIVAGFRLALEFANSTRDAIAAFVNEHASASLIVRRVLRPTRFYYLLLRRLNDFRSMTDAVTWSMQVEFIARLYDWEDETPEHWPLFAAERDALTQLNIPAFRLRADAVGALHIETGMRSSLDRIASLSNETIAQQLRMVATAIRMKSTDDFEPVAAATARAAAPANLPDVVYRHLCERAFRGRNAAAWLSLEFQDRRHASAQIASIGFDLYGGACGIGLFMAAYARVRGSSEAAEMARASITHVASILRSANSRRIWRSIGSGGGVGVGSIVYGLATIAELLDDADALDAAVTAADLLTEEAIREDRHFDLIAGVAGTSLALCKLHRATGTSALLDRAVHCLDHLESQRPRDGALWSCSEFEHRPLTGVAHGASGYALAFSRLFAATRIERYREIARSCVDFENEHFDGTRRNWPDLRPDPHSQQHQWPIQWCYGASGIGYARIAMAADGSMTHGDATRDVRHAAATTLAATDYSNDSLCCGVAGQADFLLEAGRYLEDRALARAGSTRLAAIAERWSAAGDARWDLGTKEYNLALFRGVAGIGYVALRAENPELPRVLVWE
jgi:type 2 lantibiotic biosynthesis protein LanM